MKIAGLHPLNHDHDDDDDDDDNDDVDDDDDDDDDNDDHVSCGAVPTTLSANLLRCRCQQRMDVLQHPLRRSRKAGSAALHTGWFLSRATRRSLLLIRAQTGTALTESNQNEQETQVTLLGRIDVYTTTLRD